MRCTRAGDTTSKPTAPRNPSLQPLGTQPAAPRHTACSPTHTAWERLSSLEPLVVLWLCYGCAMVVQARGQPRDASVPRDQCGPQPAEIAPDRVEQEANLLKPPGGFRWLRRGLRRLGGWVRGLTRAKAERTREGQWERGLMGQEGQGEEGGVGQYTTATGSPRSAHMWTQETRRGTRRGPGRAGKRGPGPGLGLDRATAHCKKQRKCCTA